MSLFNYVSDIRGLVTFKQDENQQKLSKFELVYLLNFSIYKQEISTIFIQTD